MNTGKSQMAIQKHFRNPLLATSALLVSLAWALPASAQVQKCVDPVTGKITFSDRGCSSGEEMTSIRVAPANSSQYRNHQPVYSQPEISQQQSGPRVTVVGDSGNSRRNAGPLRFDSTLQDEACAVTGRSRATLPTQRVFNGLLG